MEPVRTLVSAAQSRLARQAFCSEWIRALVPLAILIAVLALISRVVGSWWPSMADSGKGLPIALAAALGLAAVWALIAARGGRLGALAAASILDQRLELRDRLSTAVALQARTDVFAKAAVEDGVRCARDPKVRERMSRALPYCAPRRWWIGPSVLGLAVVVWAFVPVASFSKEAAAESVALAAAKAVSNDVVTEVVKRIEQSPELSGTVAPTPTSGDAKIDPADEKSLTPDDIRRDAMRKVAQMERKLDEVLVGEQAQELSALKDALSRMDAPKEGPGSELAQSLKRGDMVAAKKALDQLKQDIETGQLDESTKKKLEEQLQDLAKQLSEAANSKDALERALAESGLDKNLANNPEALKRAAEAAKHLNAEQREALMQALKAQQGAAGKCQKLGEACGGMGKSAGGSGSSEDLKAGAKGGDMLSELESMEQMLQSASECKGSCTKANKALGDGMSGSCNGPGGTNRGRASGERAAPEATATGTKLRKEKVELQDGEVIARQLIEGPPVVGESKRTLERVAGDIGTGSEEATDDDPVPPRLQEAHQHYFGELKKRLEARMREAAPAKDADSAAPKPPSPAGGGA